MVTVIPESPKLLTYAYLGRPVVKSHDGPGVTGSIIDELNSWNIQGDQVKIGSFDGQCFHLPAHLTEALHLLDQFICTWDPLHKGGVVDNHIREDSSFSWLNPDNFLHSTEAKATKMIFANLRRFECPDEETNKLPDDKICLQCLFCIHQFAHRLLGSTRKENSLRQK